MGTALSTFDKWCKNGETINHMQDTTKKHLVLRPKKRPKYDKHKRPSDEREAILYDWLQQAPKPIDHKAMRAKALELWPEYRDETLKMQDARKFPQILFAICAAVFAFCQLFKRRQRQS
ncbi:unnamed protein product [Aphanomyces euteiches]